MLYNDLRLYRSHFEVTIWAKLKELGLMQGPSEETAKKARGLMQFFVRTTDDAVEEVGGWDHVDKYLIEHNHNCQHLSEVSCDLNPSENISEASRISTFT